MDKDSSIEDQTDQRENPAEDARTLVEWHSDITQVGRNELVTYGMPQERIIRELSYESMVFLLLRGRLPSTAEQTILRSVIVSHVSHGITGQSTLAVRMAADTRASFLNAAIAGFSAGAGVYHQGNLEVTMRELAEYQLLGDHEVEGAVLAALAQGKRLMGFGHRFHKERDPRAETLIQIAEEAGHTGPHFVRMRQIAAIVARKKNVPANIEAVGGALLLDLGFEPEIAHIFILIGRGPMFAAAYIERLKQRPNPFQRVVVFDEVAK